MKIMIIIIFLFQTTIFSQVNYNELFSEKIIQFVEENYPGFDNKYDKDIESYLIFKNRLLLDSIKDYSGFLTKSNAYLKYFDDRHLYLKSKTLKSIEEKRFNTQKKENKFTDIEFKIIDKNFTYLKIKTFNGIFKPVLDSIIKSNRRNIRKHKYLIIDLRGNGGGALKSIYYVTYLTHSDYSFKKEFILKCTDNNMNVFIEGLSESDREKVKEAYLKSKEDTINNSQFTCTYSIYIGKKLFNRYPKHIGILVDKNTGSASELFLLMAKESPRVKVFGENTAGAIDYIMVYDFEIIKDGLYLVMPIFESAKINDMNIDGTGIMPDIYLDKNQEDQMIEIMKRWK